MSGGPRLGHAMPKDNAYLIRRIEALETRLRELASAQTLGAATVGSGGITITNSGSLKVVDANGVTIGLLGALPAAYNEASGPQPGFQLQREDGSTALFLGDLSPLTPPFKQSFQVMDRARNVIFADDANSGVGLARPHLSVGPLTNTNIATWPATTAGTWTTIASCYFEVQQPRLNWGLDLFAPAGVTGQFRLTINTTQIGSTQTVTNAAALWSDVQPVVGLAFGAAAFLELQAQVTAGAGTISAQQLFLEGTQS